MGMPDMARSWTREMVLALPDDGNRYELFGGELVVTPAPNPIHQDMVLGLCRRLDPYVQQEGIGRLFLSPADVSLDGRQLAQPDLFVIPGIAGKSVRTWAEMPRPILVIEISSPSSARYDSQVKRRWFQRAGIEEYWIVDPDARLVQRWRPGDERPEVLDQSIEWNPRGASAALTIDVVRMFDEMLGPG
jgi:Uma2 family endonuclease